MSLFREIWGDFFKVPVDTMPSHDHQIREAIKASFLDGQWYTPYDFIQFILDSATTPLSWKTGLAARVSTVLEEELAGFRLIGYQLVEITNETEIAAIEEALRTTSADKFAPVHQHLQTALSMLSDRREPDERNSIKESISAVEAVVQILTGDAKAELGAGLKKLRTNAPVHGALRSALMSLYGYTSDADGIRHALSDEPELDSADAKFMLVACSAFVLYLIAKAG